MTCRSPFDFRVLQKPKRTALSWKDGDFLPKTKKPSTRTNRIEDLVVFRHRHFVVSNSAFIKEVEAPCPDIFVGLSYKDVMKVLPYYCEKINIAILFANLRLETASTSLHSRKIRNRTVWRALRASERGIKTFRIV